MPLQDRQLDFEDFSSDTEKLSAILKRCEVSNVRHKLSYEYYRARKFALLYPTVLGCMAIGISGFVVTTESIKDHMKINGVTQVEDVLTLLVGCLGFAVGLSVMLMNQWDFGGREAMHLGAMSELENLGNKIRYNKMDRRVGVGGGAGGVDDDDLEASGRGMSGMIGGRIALGMVEKPTSNGAGKMALVVASGKKAEQMESEIKKKTAAAKKAENLRNDVSRFSGYNGAYHQINRSCKSSIPNALSRPFDLFESRLECMSLGHLGVIWDTRMRRNQIMRLACLEIYNEIVGYWAWPFGTPDIEKVIDRSMKRVARLISKDYRAPIEVDCCGFTIFRCCCRKVNNKYNALDNIWDGMEDCEREMMEVRGVADFIDTGEQRIQQEQQFEEEAYQAEKRMMKLQRKDPQLSVYSRSDRSGHSRSYYTRDDFSRGGSQRASIKRDADPSFVSRGSSAGQSSGEYSQSRGGIVGNRSINGSRAMKSGSRSYASDSRRSVDESYASGVPLHNASMSDSVDDETLSLSEYH